MIIYGIGILGSEQPPSAARARAQLDALTLATGGRSWFPNDVGETEKITPQIAHEIRNQYVIGYTPPNPANGGFRNIRVDVNVPTLSGLKLFEIMIQKGMETPAIFVTGTAGPEVEARSLEIGASDFLRKPIRKEVLLPRVRTILQRRERVRQMK